MPHDLLWTIKKHNETAENTKEQLYLQKEMIITKRNVTKTWAGRWNFEQLLAFTWVQILHFEIILPK